MPDQQQSQQQPMLPENMQIVITLPQAFVPLAVSLSENRSISLSDVSSFEAVKFDRLDEKGKPTGESYTAPAIFRCGIAEPMELTEAEAEIFKAYWNILLKQGQFLFQVIQTTLPPEQPTAAQQLPA